MFELTRRGFVGAGIAGALVVPFSRSIVHAAGTDAVVLRDVHPQLRPLAARVQAFLAKAPPLSDATLAQSRSALAAFAKPPVADIPVSELRIAGATGQPDVAIYVINAKPDGARPGILHMHGGGFVSGRAKDDLVRLQRIAATLDCAIVTVDYRVAPETRWQGSLEDNYSGLKWLRTNSAVLGVDPTKIALMGESAGGGHAALLAITARDRGEVPIAFQCLVYPMLDDRTGSSRPVPRSIGNLVWTAASNRYGWRSLLGDEPGGDRAHPAVPGRTSSVEGLPPAWIGVGSIDLFVRENIEFAGRLIDAGVMTELEVVPGAFHGFDSLPDALGLSVAISRQFNDAKIAALRRAFAA